MLWKLKPYSLFLPGLTSLQVNLNLLLFFAALTDALGSAKPGGLGSAKPGGLGSARPPGLQLLILFFRCLSEVESTERMVNERSRWWSSGGG